MSTNPVEVTERIRDYYLRYLRTIFPIQDRELASKFREQLDAERLIKGPYLEATPEYAVGKSVAELVAEGVLHPGFEELYHEEHFPEDRPLYVHQEKAIRKVVQGHRNVILATGTGSGKTEAFLIPILDRLFREREEGTLCPGIRALLLYPMNALANDQVTRLRQLLSKVPDFTFGRYIGQTPHTQREAEANFKEMFPGEPRIKNELISREQMLETPPHILLTNYAMLEYLLLRPREHVFFDRDAGNKWYFLVLDEVHIYTGAKGTEMGYLLRRLKERVRGGERMRCIATSATLGKGSEDFPALAEFASLLFDEPFSFEAGDESRQDVVEAALVGEPDTTHETSDPSWEPEPAFYLRLQKLAEEAEPDVDSFLSQENIPMHVREEIEGTNGGAVRKGASDVGDEIRGGMEAFLHALLRHDDRLKRLRNELRKRPLDLREALHIAFPGMSDSELPCLTALVDLACRANGERRLLPARYHLFVRAVEGAYLAFVPGYRVFLHRRNMLVDNGMCWRVFELAVCENCGSHFLVGRKASGVTCDYFEEALLYDLGDELEESGSFFYIFSEDHAVVPDEDEVEEKSRSSLKVRLLCVNCGALSPEGADTIDCGCEESPYNPVRGLLLERKSRVRDFCPRCSAPATSIRRFVSRQDPTCAVLGTAFYQSMAKEERLHSATQRSGKGEASAEPEDELWAFEPFEEVEASAENRNLIKVHTPSRVLVFSDNRQDAAFFACFLEESYRRFLRRRVIAETVTREAEEMIADTWKVDDLAEQLCLTADEYGLFPSDFTPRRKRIEARKWIMAEILHVERRNNLEELGFVVFDYDLDADKHLPKRFAEIIGLDKNQALCLLCILLNTMREQGAVKFPDGVDPSDEYFHPKNRQYFFRSNQSDKKKRIAAWVPGTGWSNKRLDFLMRVQEKLHGAADEGRCRSLLHNIWAKILTDDNSPFVREGFIEPHNLRGEGRVFRLNPLIFKIRPGRVEHGVRWYRCDKCGRLTTFNVLDLCPSTYRCAGKLQPCDPHEELAENHYYRLYKELMPIPMRVEEHTAQLTARRAGELQQEFTKGKIQVLSCSTTFELGVDVGELEAVFLRNVPPKPSNYIQRAGRAGRRTSSVAYILTYVPLRSHDLYYFRDPLEMVAGKVRVPVFYMENEKIARRHLHSVVLASFLLDNRDYYGEGKVEDFFVREQGEKNGLEALRPYLRKNRALLEARLAYIFDENLVEVLGLHDGSWIDALTGVEGALTILEAEIREDLETLEKILREKVVSREFSDKILRLINTILNERLIDRLAKGGVIPKYGFPVDVVELRIHGSWEKSEYVELQRDLRIAIAEYAPGSRVIAGKMEWESYAVKRLPQKEWDTFYYAVCPGCGMLHRQRTEESAENPFTECAACGHDLTSIGLRHKGAYLIPRFGFQSSADYEAKEPGLRKPSRRFITQVYYLPEDSAEKRHFSIDIARGKAVVRAAYVPRSRLVVLSHTIYRLCRECGYGLPVGERAKKEHKTPYGKECNGTLRRYKLGHEFLTDTVYLQLDSGPKPHENWLSFLYALIEGAARGLGVDRNDLDGCLYPRTGIQNKPALILFDNVPGGAGHCKELGTKKAVLMRALEEGKKLVEDCDCSPESSCYSCLRDYSNQYYHLQLSRKAALDLFDELGL